MRSMREASGSDSESLWSGAVRPSGQLGSGRTSRLESVERKRKQVLRGGQIRTPPMTRVCLPEKHKDKPGYILHEGNLVAGQTPLSLLIVTTVSPVANT